MALEDFWLNVRKAALFYRVGIHTPDATRLTPELIKEGLLRTSPGWLSHRTTADYNEADFAFLPTDELQRLNSEVEQFRSVADQVLLVRAIPTQTQLDEALRPLQEIILLLGFDRYRDPKAYRIGKQIEQALSAKRPPELVELRFHTGGDWNDAPGIWIWAFLSRDTIQTDESLKEATHRIRPLVQDAARDVAPKLFPYIAFRSVSEQIEAAAA